MFLKVALDQVSPFLISPLFATLHSHFMCLYQSLFVHCLHKPKCSIQKCHQLNRRAIPRRSRHAPVLLRGAHLVHPGAAVVLIAPVDEPCLLVYLDVYVKTFRFHVCVDLSACIPLSKPYSFSMSLNKFMKEVSNSKPPRHLPFRNLLPMHTLVVAPEVQLHCVL